MGNCVEKCTHNPQRREERQQEEEERQQREEGNEGSNVRVKVVVTKEELKWLMFELGNRGGKKLEDILAEIERGRSEKSGDELGWKPSLERILESPDEVVYQIDG